MSSHLNEHEGLLVVRWRKERSRLCCSLERVGG